MTLMILSNLLICNDVGQVGQLFQSIAYTCANTFLGALPEDLSHLSQMGGWVTMGPSHAGRVEGGVEPDLSLFHYFLNTKNEMGRCNDQQ